MPSRGNNKPSETESSQNPKGLKKVNLKGKNEPLAQKGVLGVPFLWSLATSFLVLLLGDTAGTEEGLKDGGFLSLPMALDLFPLWAWVYDCRGQKRAPVLAVLHNF